MADAAQEYEPSIFLTNEAIEQYKNWLEDKTPLYKVELVDAPQYADFDYFVYSEGVLNHLLEVKTRRHPAGTYQQEKMPIRKHAVAAYFMREEKLKTIYLVSWTNKLAILELWQLPDKVDEMVARYDRGGGKDIYALYEYSRFKPIIERERPEPPRGYRLQHNRYVPYY